MRRLLLPISLSVLSLACKKTPTAEIGPLPSSSVSSPASSETAASSARPRPMPPVARTQSIAKASNAFGFALFPRVSKSGNFVLSPASISIALTMTWSGARGDTATEMGKVLAVEGSQADVTKTWGELVTALTSPGRPLTLKIANRLFGERSYEFDKAYLDATRASFGAPLEPADFKGAYDAERVQINEWVAAQTERRIENLLPPDSLDRTTRLVLVNAIYFLGTWSNPFKVDQTVDAPFDTGTEKKTVPMMRELGAFAMRVGDGAKLLRMPYKGDEIEMLVVLPDKVDGLAALERTFTPAKLAAWSAAATVQEVGVTFPRFELKPDTKSLAGPLGELGMARALTDAADFTGMAKPSAANDPLRISEVFHKAFVKVDEKGTEAAAATAVAMATPTAVAQPRPTPFFVADHPFLFFVVDKASGLVLFMGRVTDPSVK
jgi:serpin B